MSQYTIDYHLKLALSQYRQEQPIQLSSQEKEVILSDILTGYEGVVDLPKIHSLLDDIITNGISLEHIIHIHRELLSEQAFLAGKYRTLPAEAGKLTFMPAYQIPDAMKNLLGTSLDTIEGVCVFFVESLEHIHPFQDGNRRTLSIAFIGQILHLGYNIRLHDFSMKWDTINYTNTLQDGTWRVNALLHIILTEFEGLSSNHSS